MAIRTSRSDSYIGGSTVFSPRAELGRRMARKAWIKKRDFSPRKVEKLSKKLGISIIAARKIAMQMKKKRQRRRK